MWVWFSHSLNPNTEGYEGKKSLVVQQKKSIFAGDSSNSIMFSMDNHLGTHVDAPFHFIKDGPRISDYKACDWIFNSPVLINKSLEPGELLTQESIDESLPEVDDADIVIIKTGFEKYRGTNKYWELAPGYSSDLCNYFLNKFKSIKAIGFDSISLSSLKHREEGRIAHKEFLSNNIRIFEDLQLSTISSKSKLHSIVALPLVIDGSDGGPCTIIANISK